MTGSRSRLGEYWRRAINDLDLVAISPFPLELDSGEILDFDLLVKGFGGAKGMLVASNSKLLAGLQEKIIASGYGYSVMSVNQDPGDFDLESFKETLGEWGWTGSPDEKPRWLLILGP